MLHCFKIYQSQGRHKGIIEADSHTLIIARNSVQSSPPYVSVVPYNALEYPHKYFQNLPAGRIGLIYFRFRYDRPNENGFAYSQPALSCFNSPRLLPDPTNLLSSIRWRRNFNGNTSGNSGKSRQFH